MNKAYTSKSLKNIAASIKKSIDNDMLRFKETQSIVLKPSKSTTNFHSKHKSQSLKQTQPSQNCLLQKKQKSQLLKTKIQLLSKELEENKDVNSAKSYNRELSSYDSAVKYLQKMELKLKEKNQIVIRIKGQLQMLKEDVRSGSFNLTEAIAQKQYFQQMLQTYQKQYQAQYQFVQRDFELTKAKNDTKFQIQQCKKYIQKTKENFRDWKQTKNHDFQERKLKSRITNLRCQLISSQEKGDKLAQYFNKLKIRQMICIYVKRYTQQKLEPTTKSEIQDGLEIFLARQCQVQKLKQLMLGRIKDEQYQTVINQYCQSLQKIQLCIKNANNQATRKIINSYNHEVEEKSRELDKLEQKLKKIDGQILENKSKLDLILAQQTIINIEHLKQTKGSIDVPDIKMHLKKIKQEQQKRIKTIKKAIHQINYLKQFKNSLISHEMIYQEIHQQSNLLSEAQKQYQNAKIQVNRAEKQKQKVEKQIERAVQKLSQFSEKTNTLKKLKNKYQILESEIKTASTYISNNTNTIKKTQPQEKININVMRPLVNASSKNFQATATLQKKKIDLSSFTKRFKIDHLNVKQNKPTEDKKAKGRSLTQRGSLTNLLISKFNK